MKKRETKAQKEDREMAALRLRVGDIYAGACWNDMDTKDPTPLMVVDFGRVAAGIFERLLGSKEEHLCLLKPHCAENFDTVASATEFLYRQGIRA